MIIVKNKTFINAFLFTGGGGTRGWCKPPLKCGYKGCYDPNPPAPAPTPAPAPAPKPCCSWLSASHCMMATTCCNQMC